LLELMKDISLIQPELHGEGAGAGPELERRLGERPVLF
jgi:hypothetical protein